MSEPPTTPRSRRTKALIVIAAVAIAIAALSAPFAGRLWRTIAYTERVHPTHEGVLQDRPATLLVFHKRANWLPGPRRIVPDQICASCQLNAHWECLRNRQVMAVDVGADPKSFPYACNCPVEDHDTRPPDLCDQCRWGKHQFCVNPSCGCPNDPPHPTRMRGR